MLRLAAPQGWLAPAAAIDPATLADDLLAADPQSFLRDFYRKCFLGYRSVYQQFQRELEAAYLAALGLPPAVGQSLMAVFIVSFAGTTLDSATRIQRLCLQELCKNRHGKVLRPLHNRYAATLVVVVLAAALALLQPGAKGALLLWPLFGALNQLLAALGLCIATVYLAAKGKNYLVTLLPMFFMLAVTIWAMLLNLGRFTADGNHLLTAISLVILLLTGWLLIGAAAAIRRPKI